MKPALKPIGDPAIPYLCPAPKSVHLWILNPLEKQECFWVAGRKRLKSQTKLNTAVTKFKRLLQCSSAFFTPLCLFSGVWSFLKCWKCIQGWTEKVTCPPFPTQVKQQFCFVSVKGRIQGKENTGVCSGRQKECLARQRPYGIWTKHILDLVHLIPLYVKDALRSMAKKYNFGYCFRACRDFSKWFL